MWDRGVRRRGSRAVISTDHECVWGDGMKFGRLSVVALVPFDGENWAVGPLHDPLRDTAKE